jgi:hypothetical protein
MENIKFNDTWVIQVYNLLYKKILEAPIWPLATQRIESAVSVCGMAPSATER